MPEIMLHLARPAWLLLLPLPAVLSWLLYRQGTSHSGWARLLPETVARVLLSNTTAQHRGRWWLLAGGWMLAVIALSGPSVPAGQPQGLRAEAHAVVVVLDMSRAMLATDIKPERLQRAIRKIEDLLQRNDLETGLVVYAGSAHRVAPLTQDAETLSNLLRGLHPDIMPIDGQALEPGLQIARQMLSGRPPRRSSILLITSGVDDKALQALDQQAAELGSRLAVLGIGSAEGSPVALADGGFLRDEQGRILLPRLDAKQLASTLRRHGARYHGLTLDNSDLNQLLPPLRSAGIDSTTISQTLTEQSHWLLLLLLPIAALGYRRGWLGLVLCAGLLPVPAEALSWKDLWQRPDQQAMQLLDTDPAAAARRFEDPAWRAWAWYQAADMPRAIEQYRVLVQQQPDIAEHHANLGTALAMDGYYEAALESFEQALTRAPDLRIARHNRSRVEAWLEAQRTEEQTADSKATESSPSGPAPHDQDATQPANPTPAQTDSTTSSNQTPATEETSSSGTAESNNNSQTEPAGATGEALQPAAAGNTAQPPDALQRERQQAMQQWLDSIEDNPAELLRRKFLHQHLEQQQ